MVGAGAIQQTLEKPTAPVQTATVSFSDLPVISGKKELTRGVFK